MVRFKALEVIDVADCCRARYLLDAAEFPTRLLCRVIALNAARSVELFEFGKILRAPDHRFPNVEKYEIITDFRTNGPYPQYLEHTKVWLRSLGIPANEQVYANWGRLGTVVTDWEIVCEQFDDFYQPFDTLSVFDDTLKWGVLFHPEEWVFFVREMGPVPL